MVLFYSITAVIRMIRATSVLHEKMLRNILRGPMSFFDTTPTGRIVNRFSQDVESIDLKIPQSIESFLDCFFVVISTLVIIVYSTPIFASIIVPLMLVYFAVQVRVVRSNVAWHWSTATMQEHGHWTYEACMGVLGLQDICHFTSRDIGYYPFYFQGYGILCSIFWFLSGILNI